MRFLFRADASVALGTGHVMRSATLAAYLAAVGHEVRFLCRPLPGNLIPWLEEQRFDVSPIGQESSASISPAADADACIAVVGGQRFDWLVVDHYDLAASWEKRMSESTDRILAIDDLGHEHASDMVLDQNYASPLHELYRGKFESCRLMLGPAFALLRPDFARLRATSLAKARDRVLRILIFMSGSDPMNETIKALEGVAGSAHRQATVDVVIGSSNPHAPAVKAACARLPSATLHVQTPHIAELMAAADLSLGAGGGATWERCALGLPALVTILSENQVASAKSVAAAGAQEVVGWNRDIVAADYARMLGALDGKKLKAMSACAAGLCDGGGAARVAALLTQEGAARFSRTGVLHG